MKLEEKLSKIDENWKKLVKTGQNWAKLQKIGENWISVKWMIYFLCVSSCRSGAPSFFRRARKKIDVLEAIEIGKNWEKLGKIGENWEKLGKTGKNWGKLMKTGEN